MSCFDPSKENQNFFTRPRPTALLSPSSDGKQEAATAVVVAPDDGHEDARTCWAVFKRQVINLRSCCILLVDSVESMMMHGLANPKLLRILSLSPNQDN
jgi:hypothetical protein